MTPADWLLVGLLSGICLLQLILILRERWARHLEALTYRTADGPLMNKQVQRLVADAYTAHPATAARFKPTPARECNVTALPVAAREIRTLKAEAQAAAALFPPGRPGRAVNPHKPGTRRAVVWETFYLDAVMTAEPEQRA